MTLSPVQVYWIMQLDTIRVCLEVVTATGGVLFIGWIISNIAMRDESINWTKETKRLASIGLVLHSIFLFIAVACFMFIPSTKTACAIYIVPKIMNNEQIQNNFSEVYDLGIDKLKESLSLKKE